MLSAGEGSTMAKKTTSEELIKGYDAIWKSGPSVKYNNPDSWRNTERKQ